MPQRSQRVYQTELQRRRGVKYQIPISKRIRPKKTRRVADRCQHQGQLDGDVGCLVKPFVTTRSDLSMQPVSTVTKRMYHVVARINATQCNPAQANIAKCFELRHRGAETRPHNDHHTRYCICHSMKYEGRHNHCLNDYRNDYQCSTGLAILIGQRNSTI